MSRVEDIEVQLARRRELGVPAVGPRPLLITSALGQLGRRLAGRATLALALAPGPPPGASADK